jgi:hypothetical protein
MKAIKFVIRAVIMSVLVLSATPSFADRGDIYGGIGISKNSYDGGARVFGGYTIYDQFRLSGKKVDIGVEATYIDLGSTSFGNGGTVAEKNLGATAVGSIEVLKDTRVFARVGFGQAQGKITSPVWNETKTGMVPILGVGATYALSKNFGVRADFERITGMFEDATSLSASAFLKF